MYDDPRLNIPLEQVTDIAHFADLFRTFDTGFISQYIVAELNPEQQRSEQQLLTIQVPAALEFTLNREPAFPAFQRKDMPHSLYDAVVFIKNHLMQIVDTYYFLEEGNSRQTFLALLCYTVFLNPYLVVGQKDNLVLLSDKMRTVRVESLEAILLAIAAIRKQNPDEICNLRMTMRPKRQLDVRIFVGDIDEILEQTLSDTQNVIERELEQVQNINATLGQALEIAHTNLQNQNYADFFELMKMCDTSLSAISKIVSKYYSV